MLSGPHKRLELTGTRPSGYPRFNILAGDLGSVVLPFVEAARNKSLLTTAPHGEEYARFGQEAARARAGRAHDPTALTAFQSLREQLEKPFQGWAFLWPQQAGKRGDLVDDEMDRVLHMPGWDNVFTQPIIARIEMLSTNIRTDIGVKVFGPDLNTINRVCQDVERALKDVNGARDAVAAQVMGKGYVEVRIDREHRQRAARWLKLHPPDPSSVPPR
jgi:hypothetical protein